MTSFQGKRALVTGGGKGIGRAIAIKLSQLGAEVYTVARTAKDLKSLEEEHPDIKCIQLDVSDWEKTRSFVDSLAPIHLLVNNAAVIAHNPALESTKEEFDLMFNINVKAAINVSQSVAKGLIAKKLSGRIVNVSSQGSKCAFDRHLMYCSSKAALDMVTKCFALELGPHNIRVNSVLPTVVMTDMGRLGWSDPVKAGKLLSRIPQGRFAEVEEVVNAVVFLLSDQSEMVNGHALPVDGGSLAV